MATEDQAKVHDREQRFHDRWALETTLDEISVREAFESIAAPENRYVLDLLGDLRGKRVLDIGSGLGESAIYFAMKGADVTANDISPEMVGLCDANARSLGVSIRGVVSTAESLDVPAGSFDIVYAANVIHHIVDRERFFSNVAAALRPGGTFVAWDPVKYNPIINVYRRMASEVRTEDERPLGFSDIARARRVFPNLKYRMFWLTTLVLFLRYFLVRRKHPNEMRYWKAILKEREEDIGWWFGPLQRLDTFLLRIPLVKSLAWNVVMWGSKNDAATGQDQ